jgi:hypothetical protein
MKKQCERDGRLILRLISGKTRRFCAGFLAVVFLTLTVCVASLPPDKFFAELSPQNRVDSIIRALQIIDGTSRVEDSCPSALRSLVARVSLGSGHCTDMSFISRADELISACDFTVPPAPRAGGASTVARE